MKKKLLLPFLILLPFICFGQKINDDLEIKKLTEHVYQHLSWEDIGSWGRVQSNGLIVVSEGKALMIDTPMDSGQTKNIVDFIQNSLHSELIAFIPGHWHGDCVGGMPYLHSIGVESYANQETNDLLIKNGLESAKHSFNESFTLNIGNLKVESYFLGGGHATDNIVVWIPEDKVLFGGCMVKDLSAANIGNLSDASPFPEWLSTINKIEDKFPDAKYIVPGHGDTGGKELLEHTKKMLIDLMK